MRFRARVDPPAEVIDLEDFEVDAFRQCASPVLLIVANTGDGEPTDNAVAFHKWLMDPKTPEDRWGQPRCGSRRGTRAAGLGVVQVLRCSPVELATCCLGPPFDQARVLRF